MRYVIAYDVEDDRVRLRIAKIVGRHGVRVQKSVFECSLEPDDLPRLTRRLERELQTSPGNVRIYRTCVGCLAESLGVGDDLAEGMAGQPWIVV